MEITASRERCRVRLCRPGSPREALRLSIMPYLPPWGGRGEGLDSG